MTDSNDDIEREIEQSITEATPDTDSPAPKLKRSKSEKKSKRDPKKKRGPPRPHRKISNYVLEQRIQKLQKRIDKAKAQLEDATRHIEGYHRESSYRTNEEPE